MFFLSLSFCCRQDAHGSLSQRTGIIMISSRILITRLATSRKLQVICEGRWLAAEHVGISNNLYDHGSIKRPIDGESDSLSTFFFFFFLSLQLSHCPWSLNWKRLLLSSSAVPGSLELGTRSIFSDFSQSLDRHTEPSVYLIKLKILNLMQFNNLAIKCKCVGTTVRYCTITR